MGMNVNFYATFRQIVGAKTVDLPLPDRSTVRDLVNEVVRRFPGLRTQLLDEHGELYGHVHVFINGRDAPYLENAQDTFLSPEDIVSVFPAVGGG
jgi:molybdopterin synthase sulfur carrier subunit